MNATIRGLAAVGPMAILIAGCGTAADDSPPAIADQPTSATMLNSPPPTGTPEAVDPMSEAALRQTLDRQYSNIQARDWSGAYEFSSPRCKLEVSRESAVATMGAAYAGRDFSGPTEFLITMNGSVATVVSKSFDGKGKMTPVTWTFINGNWVDDNC